MNKRNQVYIIINVVNNIAKYNTECNHPTEPQLGGMCLLACMHDPTCLDDLDLIINNLR